MREVWLMDYVLGSPGTMDETEVWDMTTDHGPTWHRRVWASRDLAAAEAERLLVKEVQEADDTPLVPPTVYWNGDTLLVRGHEEDAYPPMAWIWRAEVVE